MIVLLVLLIGTTTGFEFKCPVHAEWRLRANVYCVSVSDYVCLFHLLVKKYQDVCLKPDQSSIGNKLVFQPHFNIAKCKAARFQPIVFSTKGNSECILQKSKCDEEGQVVYSNGSSSNDILCRCDYTKGYTFVKQPNQSCFCIPSQEDCSCYRSACEKLSPDYRCINDGEIITNTKCLEIHQPQIVNNTSNIVRFIESIQISFTYTHHVKYFIIACFVVYIVLAFLTIKVFDQQMNVNETKNNTESEKRQQFIHELFLKGECGKPHFARLVFIGKNGVGKTSLMSRLLWQKKEDITSPQSTDGIEIKKCNINIKDGKWSKCDRTDDGLTRLIHQVYTKKNLDKDSVAAENLVDEENVSYDRDTSNEDVTSVSLRNNDSLEIEHSRTHGNSSMPKHIDTDRDNEKVETDLNQIQPEKINFPNEYDGRINIKETEYDQVNGDEINQMTSTIMKSSFQLREMKHDDMLALCWLWDFSGQKDFYATHQVFLSKCAVFVLVTDSLDFTTSEEPAINFEDSAQYVRFWFDAIHCYWSTTGRGRLDPPIIVVCTNEDKFKDPLEQHKRREQFKENLRKLLRNQKKKGHLRNIYFVSNTEDDDNVFEEIRKSISREAMDMPDWGRTCPLKWLLFQQVLGKLKESGVPISSTTKLSKIANHDDIGIQNDKEFKLCLQYFHDNGTVIYFEEESLQDHVILDPKWLVDAFRCLVSDKIDTVIKISDHWQKLTETGELTEKLICDLFKKEPKLHFLENKSHLLQVMKRFDIIVNLKNSSALYMPCMMKHCTFEEVKKQFIDEGQSFYRTSWLCLDFEFLPPAFFNHILAWYITQYSVSVLTEKGTLNERKALYRQVGVFNLNVSGWEQLVVCEGPNVIALQVWNSRISDKTYENFRKKLCKFVDTLRNRYRLKLTFTIAFKCKDGDFTINRQKMNIFPTTYYRCSEHKTTHKSADLVQPWYVGEEQRVFVYEKDSDSEGW